MSIIKNKVLASLLSKIGHDVKAELVIDDATGSTLTFPDISEISEITEGVAVSAADGTYTIADGEKAFIIVVAAGKVDSITEDMPEVEASTEDKPETQAELDADLIATLEAVTDEVVAIKKSYTAVTAELKELKASLKHDTTEGKKPAEAKTEITNKFKIVD